jgi:hypothetical protein
MPSYHLAHVRSSSMYHYNSRTQELLSSFSGWVSSRNTNGNFPKPHCQLVISPVLSGAVWLRGCPLPTSCVNGSMGTQVSKTLSSKANHFREFLSTFWHTISKWFLGSRRDRRQEISYISNDLWMIKSGGALWRTDILLLILALLFAFLAF